MQELYKIVPTTRLRTGTGDPEGEVTPSERPDCGVSNCWIYSQQVRSVVFYMCNLTEIDLRIVIGTAAGLCSANGNVVIWVLVPQIV